MVQPDSLTPEKNAAIEESIEQLSMKRQRAAEPPYMAAPLAAAKLLETMQSMSQQLFVSEMNAPPPRQLTVFVCAVESVCPPVSVKP